MAPGALETLTQSILGARSSAALPVECTPQPPTAQCNVQYQVCFSTSYSTSSSEVQKFIQLSLQLVK